MLQNLWLPPPRFLSPASLELSGTHRTGSMPECWPCHYSSEGTHVPQEDPKGLSPGEGQAATTGRGVSSRESATPTSILVS